MREETKHPKALLISVVILAILVGIAYYFTRDSFGPGPGTTLNEESGEDSPLKPQIPSAGGNTSAEQLLQTLKTNSTSSGTTTVAKPAPVKSPDTPAAAQSSSSGGSSSADSLLNKLKTQKSQTPTDPNKPY